MADFSSYVTVRLSNLVPPLTLVNAQANRGSYGPEPQQSLAPGSISSFQLHDPSGPYGSDGAVTYSGTAIDLHAEYACPYWSSNTGSVSVGGTGGFVADWYAQSGGGWVPGAIPGSGHPLRLFVGLRAASEPILEPE